MTQPTINRDQAIDLFRQMMGPHPAHRALRLLGEAKMGKSHLLTKVFPALAQQQYNTACAVVDLRGGSVTVPDILHRTCAQLGGEARFPTYHAAYEAWLNKPLVQVSGLQALLSSVTIRSADPETGARRIDRRLTAKFVADLRRLSPLLLLFMFDALDSSEKTIQNWLMDELLVSLIPLEHVRVVVAGRDIPAAAGSYAARCLSHELTPVEDEDAYIVYCRHLKLTITEQSIKDIARLLDHKPGLFVDLVLPKFSQGGVARG